MYTITTTTTTSRNLLQNAPASAMKVHQLMKIRRIALVMRTGPVVITISQDLIPITIVLSNSITRPLTTPITLT
jgi:hypothetical protein